MRNSRAGSCVRSGVGWWAKELSLAQLIGVTDRRVYENLGLTSAPIWGGSHRPVHRLLHLTPWEATVVAADVAMKSGNVELGFLDRFSGAVILLAAGRRSRAPWSMWWNFFGRSWASPSVKLRSGDKER